MAATALAARLPRPRGPATFAPDGQLPLGFHTPGGPLVAVCGLAGGAGTSTLAYLLARRAARHSNAPVLLAELGPQGALAALAGAASPFGLAELAQAVCEQRPVAQPFAQLDSGLRLVASTRPAASGPVSPDAVAWLLADAREAHGLVVLDAGLEPAPDRDGLLAGAEHTLLVVPASPGALRRIELLVDAGVFRRARRGSSTLVAIATRPGRLVGVKELRRLAERCSDRLLLVPHIPALAADQPDRADGPLEDTFGALATILCRPR